MNLSPRTETTRQIDTSTLQRDNKSTHLKIGRLERRRIITPVLHPIARSTAALVPLALDVALGVPPEPGDLELLISDDVVLLAEQLSDGLLLLLESGLENE